MRGLLWRSAPIFIVLWLALGGLSVVVGSALRNDEISFVSSIDGRSSAYILDTGRGILFRYDSGSAYVATFIWSPDGSEIAMTLCRRQVHSYHDLCSLYFGDDRGNRRPGIESVFAISWSPDNRYLLFSGIYPNPTLYSLDLQSRSSFPLGDYNGGSSSPSWSPDGESILLTRYTVGMANNPLPRIHRISADGSRVEQLTDHHALDSDPQWSPNGQRIAFTASEPSRSQTNLYVMDADGGNLRRLTESGSALYPGWSPDSQRVAFLQDKSLYLAEVDSGDLTLLAEGASPFAPLWASDGERVYYVSADQRLHALHISSRRTQPLLLTPIMSSIEGGRRLMLRP
jgi:Tol biopolymer transport system component